MQNNNYYPGAEAPQTPAPQASAPVQYKSFSNFMEKVGSKLVEKTLNDPKRRTQFIANIISAVSTNPTLQSCDQASIVSAALQAEVLHFPVNNSLGYVYLVPYQEKEYNKKTKKREVVRTVAQFQIGYKGYLQLAIRSGQYHSINVVEVKEGELLGYSPFGECEFKWISDYQKRKVAKTVGYVGELELVNGFKKQVYFSYEEILDHANTYSQAFDKNIYLRLQKGEVITDENGKDISWKFSSFWYKDFDAMAKKTVIRHLLSKWGIMSVEMQTAYLNDQATFDADGRRDYIDSKEFTNSTTDQVAQQQLAENGSIKPTTPTPQEQPTQADEEPVVDTPNSSEGEDWMDKFDQKYNAN